MPIVERRGFAIPPCLTFERHVMSGTKQSGMGLYGECGVFVCGVVVLGAVLDGGVDEVETKASMMSCGACELLL